MEIASEADRAIRDGCQNGWWLRRPFDAATVFAVDIEQATFISWETAEGQMTVRRWSPEHGYVETQRSYP